MSKAKLRIHRTDLDNLVSNLRGEVGEVITSWTLLRALRGRAASQRTKDIRADMQNAGLVTLEILIDKLEDEIVARLSELADSKVGQLTFFFAAQKLDAFHQETRAFQQFVTSKGFVEKRNVDISHKALPETFDDHHHRHIPYRTLLVGVARASRLMKLIDRRVLGPSAPYSWRKMREKRYRPMTPPKAGYLIMPHIRLSEAERAHILRDEMEEGRVVLTEMPTVVDGVPRTVLVAKEWGGLLLGTSIRMLPEYPIQSISHINTTPDAPSDDTAAAGSTT